MPSLRPSPIVSIFASLAVALFLVAGPAAAECDYLVDDFSGLSANTWSFSGAGTVSTTGGRLLMNSIPAGAWAVGKTAFYPLEMFRVDVDVETTGATSPADAVALYAWTTWDTVFTIGDHAVDGVAVVYYPSTATAAFMVWNAEVGTWDYTAKYPVSGTVSSIGLSVEAGGATIRINRNDTDLVLAGDFSWADMAIDSLWLMAAGEGMTASFDNLCSDPVWAPATGGGGGGGAVQVPGAPADLGYTMAGSALTMSWDVVDGATGYYLYVALSPGAYGSPVDLGNITSLGPLDISGLPAGTYYLSVAAYNDVGGGSLSNEIAITVSPPGSMAPLYGPYFLDIYLDGSSLLMSWDGVLGAAGYELALFWDGSFGPPVDVGTMTRLGPLDISGLPAGTYQFGVRSYNSGSTSDWSNAASIVYDGSGGGTGFQKQLTHFNVAANRVMDDFENMVALNGALADALNSGYEEAVGSVADDLDLLLASAATDLNTLIAVEDSLEGSMQYKAVHTKIEPATIVLIGLMVREFKEFVDAVRDANNRATQARRNRDAAMERGDLDAARREGQNLTQAGYDVQGEIGFKLVNPPFAKPGGWCKVATTIGSQKIENRVKRSMGITRPNNRIFVTRGDENGNLPVPAGQNDMVIVQPGAARTGAQGVTVNEGQTTTIEQTMVPVEDANPADVAANDEGTYADGTGGGGNGDGGSAAVTYTGTAGFSSKTTFSTGAEDSCSVSAKVTITMAGGSLLIEAPFGGECTPDGTSLFGGAYGGDGRFDATFWEQIVVSGTFDDTSFSGSGIFKDCYDEDWGDSGIVRICTDIRITITASR